MIGVNEMAQYRDKWFKANPSPTGKYRCSCCGGWFSKKDIDIDHIIPQNKGGTDELWNLQPMCKHCNRSKSDDTIGTVPDLAQNILVNLANGRSIDNVGEAIGSVITKNACNSIGAALGIKKKRSHQNSQYRKGYTQGKSKKW